MAIPVSGQGVIARAFVEVLPDVARFARTLTRDLRRVTRQIRRLNVNVGVGSVVRASRELSKLNLALRTTIAGFLTLGGRSVVGGFVAASGAAAELSGALALLPAGAAGAGAVMGTLAVGLRGVDDALKDFDDPEKFADALKDLSKNAREALGVLNEFRPEIQAFRDAVQDALFLELDDVARELGRTALPLVKEGFTGIASEINLAARDFAKFILSAQTLKDVDTILDNTRRSLAIMRPVAAALGQAFLDVATVGSQFLPLIAAEVTVLAVRLRDFVAQARASGELGDFIARGVATLRTAVEVVVNLGRSVFSIMNAAREAGVSLLGALDRLTERMANFLASAEGQEAVRELLENARQAAVALGPVLQALGSLVGDQLVPILAEFATIVGPAVVTFIRHLEQAFAVARPGIRAFAEGFAAFVEGIAPALPAIGRLAGAIGTLLGGVLERLAPVVERVLTILADALTEALSNPALQSGLVALGEAFGVLLEALAPIIPDLAELAGVILQGLAEVLKKIGPPLADLIGKLVDALLPVMPDLVDAFVDLVDAVVPLAEEILPALVDLFAVLAPLLPPIVQLLVFALRLLTPLLKVIGPIIEAFAGLVELVADAIEFIDRWVQTALTITGMIPEIATSWENTADRFGTAAESEFGRVGSALDSNVRKFIEWHQGVAAETGGAAGSAAGFATNTGTAMERAAGAIKTGMDKIRDILHPGFKAAEAAGSAAFAGIAAGASRGMGGAVAAAASGIGQIGSILRGQDFGAAGEGLIRSLAAGMRRAISFAVEAAKAAAAAIARALPGSPAEIGAFSGRGWTPFRGRALVEGLAEGIRAGTDVARDAALRLATLTSDALPQLAGTTGLTVPPLAPAGVPSVLATVDSRPVVNVEARVLLDGRELRGVVTEVVTEDKRETRRAVLTGVRRTP